MFKMMMAAAGLSIGLLAMPVATTTPAQAGVEIDINIGGKKQVSCGRGRRIVDDYGYYDVRARDCSGRYYSYFGRNRGKTYIITFDSRRARITDVRRIRW